MGEECLPGQKESGTQKPNPHERRRRFQISEGWMLYPTSDVVDSRSNGIMRGFESPASEIILDYQALLATNRPATSPETAEATGSDIPRIDPITAPGNNDDPGTLQKEITNLKEELCRAANSTSSNKRKTFRRHRPPDFPPSAFIPKGHARRALLVIPAGRWQGSIFSSPSCPLVVEPAPANVGRGASICSATPPTRTRREQRIILNKQECGKEGL